MSVAYWCGTCCYWVSEADPCDCAARDRAEDRSEHMLRDEGEL